MKTFGGGIFCVLTIFAAGTFAHLCERPCATSPEPMQCNYKFILHAFLLDCDHCQRNSSKITKNQCGSKNCDHSSKTITLAINRQSPGPTIQVCKGDRVVVDVENRLPSGFETSIHWHGQLQRGTPFYDGVSKVTQCPVIPGSSFRYSFKADQPGTHFYSANSVSQHADGLYGAFIVNDHNDNDLESKVLLVGTRNSALTSGAYGAPFGALVGKQRPVAKLVLNGQEEPDTFAFNSGGTVFKLINAAAYDCPLNLEIENHILKIVRTEGSEVLPMFVKSLTIYPGERYDFQAHRIGDHCDNCQLKIKGFQKCSSLANLEMRMLSTAETGKIFFRPEVDYESLSANCSELDAANLCSADLEGFAPPDFVLTPEATFHLRFGQHRVPKVSSEDLEFRFVFDDVGYYPTFLDSSDEDGTIVPHINYVSYRPPSTPVLTQPDHREFAFECETGKGVHPILANRPRYTCKNAPSYCECNHYIKVGLNSTVKLVLDHQVNEKIEPSAHTFHLHGHKMFITNWSSGHSTVENIVKRPIARDTITVPPSGIVSAVFRASNPGFWLLESRAGHITTAGVGMALIVQVGDTSEMSQVPKGFPTCNGHKPDDFIF